jgi:hypothetical protein
MMDPHGQTTIISTTIGWSIVERLSSRKFLLTVFVQAIGAFGFLHGNMEAGTYVAISSLVLSSYSAASIVDKKINGPS